MTLAWKKLIKWTAGKAFTWGLKKLTEVAPDVIEPKSEPKKPRSRKPYAH